MKNLKKIWLIIICIILCTGCFKKTAKDTVVDYLNEYRNLSVTILNSLNKVVSEEVDLTESQKTTYKDILKKQYKDLSYEITNELYDGNTATFTVKIEVYDLYKASKNSSIKLANDPQEFYENNIYSQAKYLDYKLNEMKNASDRIDYSIEIDAKKIEDEWYIEELTLSNLQKIHGIYNYDEVITE